MVKNNDSSLARNLEKIPKTNVRKTPNHAIVCATAQCQLLNQKEKVQFQSYRSYRETNNASYGSLILPPPPSFIQIWNQTCFAAMITFGLRNISKVHSKNLSVHILKSSTKFIQLSHPFAFNQTMDGYKYISLCQTSLSCVALNHSFSASYSAIQLLRQHDRVTRQTSLAALQDNHSSCTIGNSVILS